MTFIVETDIESQIRVSETLSPEEKEQFLHLLSYFTPGELEELKMLL